MSLKALRVFVVCAAVAFTCVGCVSSEFRRHYETGASAADAGDFKTAITELETALAIDPGVSLAWHKLAYAYDSVGRRKDAWIAMRKAVILNPISSERKQGFYANWRAMKQGISLGASSMDIRRHLGDPDVEAKGKGYALWTYGLVSLEFQDEKLSAIKE